MLEEYYFGRVRIIDGDGDIMDRSNHYIEWIGPMTEKRMEDEHEGYRHNRSRALPTSGTLILGEPYDTGES